MLSREQRNHVDMYALRNGMRNIAYISGIARNVSARSGYIQQTRNLNQLIPFELDGTDSMPGWIREGAVIKIIARVTGRLVRRNDDSDSKGGQQREMVLRVMKFEVPSVLEMPPEAAWAMSVPKGAPSNDETPEDGKHGLPFSKGSNLVEIAGFVSGVLLRKAGVPGPDGKRPSGCLLLNIQQTKNPDEAIPVRVYGKLTEAIESKIKLGSPVYIQSGEARIDVKETGVMLEGDIAEVTKVLYVKSQGLFIATRDHIAQQPQWAIDLALAGRALKGKPPAAAATEAAERPALKVAALEEGAATAAAATPAAEQLDAEDEAAVAAAAAELGVTTKR
jgi:hypothetical protein